MSKRLPWAVVCDFDGTATLDDTADALSIAYIGRGAWQAANDAFQAGAIDFTALLRRMFEPVGATSEEVRAFALRHVRFRPGFAELLLHCRSQAVPLVLASGGLDVYIRPALEKLPPGLADGLELRANHAEFVPGGLALSFPWQDAPGACGRCGSCKGAVVKELQGKGHRVVAVGDGNADRCMVGVADALFARGRLLDWCRRREEPCTPFETLAPVLELLQAA